MNIQDDNFNPDKTLKYVAEHIDQPEKFAKLFCNAAESQISIDKIIRKKIRNLLTNDPQTISQIKKLQREVDKEDWRYLVKKAGLGILLFIWSLIVVAIVVIVQYATKNFLGIHSP